MPAPQQCTCLCACTQHLQTCRLVLTLHFHRDVLPTTSTFSDPSHPTLMLASNTLAPQAHHHSLTPAALSSQLKAGPPPRHQHQRPARTPLSLHHSPTATSAPHVEASIPATQHLVDAHLPPCYDTCYQHHNTAHALASIPNTVALQHLPSFHHGCTLIVLKFIASTP